jgi:protein involved in polysaccharide export with SLBB domain
MSRLAPALALLLAAAAAAAQDPAPPARPDAPAVHAPSDYLIGPSDILKVTVYGHPDLTQSVLVQPDGTFTFP